MNPYGQPAYPPYRPPRRRMPTALLIAIIVGPLLLIMIVVYALAPDVKSAPEATTPAPAFTGEPAPLSGAAKAKAWLEDNFGQAPWYPTVTDLHYQADQIWVDTILQTKQKTAAEGICQALSGYLLQTQGRAQFGGVRVAAKDGTRMVWRRGFTGTCAA